MLGKRKANQDVRDYLKKRNIKQWELADFLGCSETTMSRHLRKELKPVEKEWLKEKIDKMVGLEIAK